MKGEIVNFIDLSSRLWPGIPAVGVVLSNEYAWCKGLSFDHAVLNQKRVVRFLRENADGYGGLVVVGFGSTALVLVESCMDIGKPVRLVLDAGDSPADRPELFNNILLMYSGTFRSEWIPFRDRLTLGLFRPEHRHEVLRIASTLDVTVETSIDVSDVEIGSTRVVRFQWLWASISEKA